MISDERIATIYATPSGLIKIPSNPVRKNSCKKTEITIIVAKTIEFLISIEAYKTILI